jgi:hypothetical protein
VGKGKRVIKRRGGLGAGRRGGWMSASEEIAVVRVQFNDEWIVRFHVSRARFFAPRLELRPAGPALACAGPGCPRRRRCVWVCVCGCVCVWVCVGVCVGMCVGGVWGCV